MDKAFIQNQPNHQIIPVGDHIANWLHEIGVTTVFGVISIHNMPILDAIYRQGKIRFVSARGEAGAMNMADAYARVSQGLGVVITSTGTAAGNAAGSQVEALTACSPILHITTQVDRMFSDRDRAAIHDVPRQPQMLNGISKAVYRVWEGRQVLNMLSAGVSEALSSPSGPVVVEIPIDVQREKLPSDINLPLPSITMIQTPETQFDKLAAFVKDSKRPMLWLGGGAHQATTEASELVKRGFAVVTSTHGRAIVSEIDEASLGAFNMTPEAQSIYQQCDLMIIVGSRLRGNETLNNQMRLPEKRIQIDADATQGARNYPVDLFIHADAKLALKGLLDRIPQKLSVDPSFLVKVKQAREQSEKILLEKLGPYATFAKILRHHVFKGKHPFVRDITLSNSIFGNRYVTLASPNLGVHALGGGIGQGNAMAIGAALVKGYPKTVALIGDGGVMLSIGEWATAVEEKANIVFILMNDQGYGVIRNIQDAQYDGRHCYTLSVIPNFSLMAASVGMPYYKIDNIGEFDEIFSSALQKEGPILLEIDMVRIGPFAQAFSGPPAGAAGDK